LNQANADMLMERFVSDYPTSTKVIRHLLKHIIILIKETILKQWFEKVKEKVN
jgi:hypothetical protein